MINTYTQDFANFTEYKAWRLAWKTAYKELSANIRATKDAVKTQMREGKPVEHVKVRTLKALARTSMASLEAAKVKMAGITRAKKEAEANAFPQDFTTDKLDFHFNKKHLEDSNIPMWVIKTKGKTFYVNHVTSLVPWSTKETPDHPSTKGALRVKKCRVAIDAEGHATLS